MLGLAGTADMREVVGRSAAGDAQAGLALGTYLHRLRGGIAAMAASMGGVDGVAFTGGVGENAPVVRAGAAGGLGFLGLAVDPDRNQAGTAPDRVISPDGSPVVGLVLAAREDLQIAGETRTALGAGT